MKLLPKSSKSSALNPDLIGDRAPVNPTATSVEKNVPSAERFQAWFDALLQRIISPRRRSRGAGIVVDDRNGVQTVKVNLIGDAGKVEENLSLSDAANPFKKQPDDQSIKLAEAWEFQKPALLKSGNLVSSAFIWTSVALTTGGLLWIFLAPLDETVLVQGRLQPGSRVKPILSVVQGRVDSVLVKDGQQVKKGQALLVFDVRDPRIVLSTSQALISRLTNENKLYAASLGDSSVTKGLTNNQLRQLKSQRADLLNRRMSADEELAKSTETLKGLKIQYDLALNQYQRFKQLADIGAGSLVQALEYLTKAEDLRARIATQERETQRLRSQRISAEANPDAEIRNRIETNLKEINNQQRQADQARLQIENSTLTSPVDGVVFNISVQRGSVVSANVDPTSPLMSIVPSDNLIARVFIPNTTIGFVVPGQHADVSTDAFPSAYFGRVSAKVTKVGSDAVPPKEINDSLGAQATGLYFPASLRLDKQYLERNGVKIPLMAGMTVNVDIRLQQRTMADIILKWGHDNFRSVERIRSTGN
jgi:HlyD family secretion protein